MDPLSLTAGVIAIIQMADKIISVCKDYVTTVKDAPKDLRTIMFEVGSLKCVVEVLELLLSQETCGDASNILRRLNCSDGALEGCKKSLRDLESLFPAPKESATDGKRQKLLCSLTRLAWPFKADKARKLLDDIGRHKITISLSLTTEAVYVSEISSYLLFWVTCPSLQVLIMMIQNGHKKYQL
jgi:hypothetical protein